MQKIRNIYCINPKKDAKFSNYKPRISDIWAIFVKQEFFEKFTFFQSFTITKTYLLAKTRKITDSVPEKKANILISSQRLGRFGPFWPNKNVYRYLNSVKYLLLARLIYMQKIRKIQHSNPEVDTKLSTSCLNLGKF